MINLILFDLEGMWDDPGLRKSDSGGKPAPLPCPALPNPTRHNLMSKPEHT